MRRNVVQEQLVTHSSYIITEIDLKVSVHYQGCKGATCREIMSLQPAPRAQMTSWPTGSVALLKHKYNLFDPLFYSLWIARYGTRTHWFTCRSPPAERGSNSWPTRGSDQSAGWGSGRSLGSAGYFLWLSTRLPSLPPDNHLDPNMKGGQPKIDKVLQKKHSFILKLSGNK